MRHDSWRDSQIWGVERKYALDVWEHHAVELHRFAAIVVGLLYAVLGIDRLLRGQPDGRLGRDDTAHGVTD